MDTTDSALPAPIHGADSINIDESASAAGWLSRA